MRRGFERTANANEIFTPDAVADYVRCFCDPATIHGTCEDYRAGASIDLAHDDADFDDKVNCPMFALWSATGYVGRTQDVLATWINYATNVQGSPCPAATSLPRKCRTRPTTSSRTSCKASW